MTIDRQQTRRDVEKCLSQRTDWLSAGTEPPDSYAQTFARHCLALLTELELAESEIEQLGEFYAAAKARLANVPPLIQAFRQLIALAEDWSQDWSHGGAENANERLAKAIDVLAAYENNQGT